MFEVDTQFYFSPNKDQAIYWIIYFFTSNVKSYILYSTDVIDVIFDYVMEQISIFLL